MGGVSVEQEYPAKALEIIVLTLTKMVLDIVDRSTINCKLHLKGI